MSKTLSGLVAAALLVVAAPAAAHHSAAMYEPTKVSSLSGTVMAFDWKNPHAWIEVAVKQPSGEMEEWKLECSTPNILARKGWSNGVLKAGDKVSLTMRPMKDGSHEGLVLTVTTTKGVVLKDHDY